MGQITDSVPPPSWPPAFRARKRVAGHPTAPRWAVTHATWAPVLGHVVGLGGTFVGEDRAEAGPCAGIALTKHFTTWLSERRDRHRAAQPRVRGAGRPHPASNPRRAHRRRRHRDAAHGAAADLDAGGVAAPEGARGRRPDLPLREGKWQRSHLEAAPLREAAVWIERFRGFWDSSFDRLDAHLATLQQEQENR